MVSHSVASARCVLFAYHEMGHACIETLLALGAPIAALYTHRDNPDEEVWWRSCAELASRNRIPVHFVEKLSGHEIEAVAGAQPAVIYSIYYRHLLPQGLLRLADLGAFNLHGSLLPRYRGRAPVNWVLVNGERETGVTLHHMVARADAGDIVAQRAVPITDDDTAATLYQKLVPVGAELIREFHPRIVDRTAPGHPQDVSRGSYFGRRRPEDGRIDWSWPARRIFNLVRAVTHPYPGAFSTFDGKRLLVWRARVGAETGAFGEPGTLLRLDDSGDVEVAAGQGTVMISAVQFEGDSECAAAPALRGAQIAGRNKLG